MSQFDLTLLIVPLLVLATIALLLILIMPWIEARALNKRRMTLALGRGHSANAAATGGGQTAAHRKAIERTLKEIEERQSQKVRRRSRPGLDKRLREAGLTWSPFTYWLVSASVATGAFVASSSLGLPISGAIAVSAGLLMPRFYVMFLRHRRLAAFAAGFPDVIDLIVRGVRAGRPLADCVAVVAADSADPIRSEFRQVVEDQSVGVPMHEAVEKLAQRVPLQEVGFLAIVVAIQNRAGGNLTEALSNLSTVLRGRRQLHAKVKAMSAEAKTSAGIIGSLPVIVAALVQLTSPEYLAILYQTNAGIIVIVACAVWMSIGVFVMRQMINFDM
ncbi:pilus assembly protein [Marivita lacus]|uniref:Pilus assembly protein n=1 Tax=Marivita lacus TaxID=1323742 RepID=A0ABQ1KDW8_9RHOB|nr:type II secretion system F family protein [Marivita lacus]GGB94979.1 pilus assembly protein [Marivita lacus]